MDPPSPGAPGVIPEAERITASALELLGGRRLRFFERLDADAGAVTCVAAAGPSSAGSAEAEHAFGRLSLQDGRPICTVDVLAEPRLALEPSVRELVAREGVAALAAAPIRTRGRTEGSLVLADRTGRRYTDHELRLLAVFADQMALVLNNGRTQEVLAKQAERLQILHEIDRAIITETAPVAIAEAVLGRLRDLLGVPRAIVNLFDFAAGDVEWLAAAGRHRMHVGPGVRYPLTLAGDLDALRRGEPQVVDVHALPASSHTEALLASGVQTYMVVPMIVAGELIGSVSFGGPAANFPEEQVRIAQEVATQMGIAISQARLHEQVERQAAELEERVKDRTRALEAANRELADFTHTVSHDLKTPLRAMDGFARALEEDFADRLDDTGRQFLSKIQASATRMAELIDDLLEYSRLDHRAGARGQVPLAPLVARLLDELAGELEARGVTVTMDLAVAAVTGETQGLHEALANLLSNAIKFSPAQAGAISIRSFREGDDIVIAVADKGIGFDMRYHDRIFGIFERLHRQEEYPGTGVGLAIVRKVAERHDGRAWAQSEVGRGSVFFLAIPNRPE